MTFTVSGIGTGNGGVRQAADPVHKRVGGGRRIRGDGHGLDRNRRHVEHRADTDSDNPHPRIGPGADLLRRRPDATHHRRRYLCVSVSSSSADGAIFASREAAAANRPKLTIQYNAAPVPTPTPTPTATPTPTPVPTPTPYPRRHHYPRRRPRARIPSCSPSATSAIARARATNRQRPSSGSIDAHHRDPRRQRLSQRRDGRFRELLRPAWGQFKARTMPGAGNHEYETPARRRTSPTSAPPRATRRRATTPTTSAPGTIIVLNSNCARSVGCAAGLAAGAVAAGRPRRQHRACTLAYWHQPRFSSGDARQRRRRSRRSGRPSTTPAPTSCSTATTTSTSASRRRTRPASPTRPRHPRVRRRHRRGRNRPSRSRRRRTARCANVGTFGVLEADPRRRALHLAVRAGRRARRSPTPAKASRTGPPADTDGKLQRIRDDGRAGHRGRVHGHEQRRRDRAGLGLRRRHDVDRPEPDPHVGDGRARTPSASSRATRAARAAPATLTITVTPGSDTQPPTDPTNFTATANGSSRIDLAWTAPTDNVGFLCDIFRDGSTTPIASVASTTVTFADTGLTQSTTYSYTIPGQGPVRQHLEPRRPSIRDDRCRGIYAVGHPRPSRRRVRGRIENDDERRHVDDAALRRLADRPELPQVRPDCANRTVNKATLRVYANSASTAGYTVGGTATSWTETGLTAANAPPIGSSVGGSGSITAGSWTSVDVTSLVATGGAVAFGLTGSSATAVSLASRESGANAPQLVLEITP